PVSEVREVLSEQVPAPQEPPILEAEKVPAPNPVNIPRHGRMRFTAWLDTTEAAVSLVPPITTKATGRAITDASSVSPLDETTKHTEPPTSTVAPSELIERFISQQSPAPAQRT